MLRYLKQNIKKRIPGGKVSGGYDHLMLEAPMWAQDDLRYISGIRHFFIIETHNFGDLQDIFELVLDAYATELAGKNFCVRIKRSGEHDFTSMDAERYIGGGLLKHTKAKKVDLHTPEVTVQLEIKQSTVHFLRKRTEGISGFPIGSQGRVLSLISGGFDSPLATAMMMEKGLEVDYCFFDFGGRGHREVVERIVHFLWKQRSAEYNARIHIVPFEPVIEDLLKTNHKYRGILLKRAMLHVAEGIAMQGRHQALVTGESLAQVSSQTIDNLAIIERDTKMMVFRPLLAIKKQEIIQRAESLGTAHFSCGMEEFCAVVSDKPSAKAKARDVLLEEEKMDKTFLERALEEREIFRVSELLSQVLEEQEVPTFTPRECLVLDIRPMEEMMKKPMENADLAIPFPELMGRFASLNQERSYGLFCSKGILSKEYAQRLREQGYENVGMLQNSDT